MKTTTINFADEFTDCPGGRLRIHGDFSGEEFREKFLIPALESSDKVILNLNGVLGLPASFIDEAFGQLVPKYGLGNLKSRLEYHVSDNRLVVEEINEVMKGHAA